MTTPLIRVFGILSGFSFVTVFGPTSYAATDEKAKVEPPRAFASKVLEILPPVSTREQEEKPKKPLEANWKLTNSGAILQLDDGLPLGQQFSIRLKTPTPQDDWTLDFTISGRDDFEFLMNHVGYTVKWREGDLPVHQVRFYYNSSKKQLLGWANGTALFRLDRVPPPSAGTILGWSVTSYGNYGPRSTEISDIVLAAGQPQNAPSPLATEPLGLAFNGWKSPTDVALSPAIVSVLQTLSAPTETFETRAYSLAAQVVATPKAPLSADLWEQIQKLIGELKDKPDDLDVRAAMLVLPLAVARMSVTQRTSELPKLRTILDKVSPILWGPRDDIFLARVGLLSPVRAIEATNSGDKRVPAAFVEDWIAQIKSSRPDMGLNATARLIRQEGSGSNAFAWFLPQLRASSPTLYKEVLKANARSPKEARLITSGFDNIRPEMANKAVYRLAEVAPDDAARFFQVIDNPKMRIEAAQFLAEKSGAFSAEVDREYAKAIDNFRPSRTEHTRAQLLIERARYHKRFGKTASATKFVDDAIAQAGEEFGSVGAIYHYLRDQKDARTPAWLEKWRKAAIQTDKDQDDSGGGGIYLSATLIVVSELVQRGQLDAALMLTKTLDEVTLSSNRRNALSAVAYALAISDTSRALQIAKELPTEDQERVVVGIAAKLARQDFARGWALLDRVSPERKAAAVLRFSPLAPPSFAPQIRALLQQAIETRLARPEHLRYGINERNLAGVENSSPEVLASLQSSFQKDRTLLARDLFLSIGTRAGLENDPLWKRIKATETLSGSSVVWAPTYLKDVQRSAEQNKENGLDFDDVSLSGGKW